MPNVTEVIGFEDALQKSAATCGWSETAQKGVVLDFVMFTAEFDPNMLNLFERYLANRVKDETAAFTDEDEKEETEETEETEEDDSDLDDDDDFDDDDFEDDEDDEDDDSEDDLDDDDADEESDDSDLE